MIVIDSSAALAVLRDEPGSIVVEAALADAAISSANAAEVYSKAHLFDVGLGATDEFFGARGVSVVPLSLKQAIDAGSLAPITRKAGLSLGDRCCLALAREHHAEVLTADRAWVQFADELGLKIRLIR